MNNERLQHLLAHEILDSRGNPTVEATVVLENGEHIRASVPSGASTGTHEALELRDNDPHRYDGKGVLTACKNITERILPHLRGMRITDLTEIDARMVELDGTKNKSNLGANATLAVSLACARAGSVLTGKPLFRYLRELYELTLEGFVFPTPMFNIVNGGRHADNGLNFQEYHLLPEAPTFRERFRIGAEVYASLKHLLLEQHRSTLVGDEGGFAPPFISNTEPLELISKAADRVGYTPGKKVFFGLDVAASEFFEKGIYTLKLENRNLTSSDLLSWYQELAQAFPLRLLEDGMDQEDWEGWKQMTGALGKKMVLVGDDLFVTNPSRLAQGIAQGAANAILIKPNQIGTLSETIETIREARAHGYTIVVSNRSGETEDDFLADLCVAVNAPYIKAGAPARSERLVKYHRLLSIEEELEKERNQ